MKRVILITFLIGYASLPLFSQGLYMTRSGQVSFFSKTPMENIEAVNNEVTSMLNTSTGEIVFAVLVKSFHFERALMEEHFNENYMESDKLPKSTFQGKIVNMADVDPTREGSYAVTVEGDLTIHGVKQSVTTSGVLEIQKSGIILKGNFIVKPADYKIQIPSLVSEKIAKTIDVKINCLYEPK